MQTPNTKAGRVTEKVMAAVKKRLPDMSTYQYNRTYEGVLEALSLEFPPESGVVKFPGGGGMFIDRK